MQMTFDQFQATRRRAENAEAMESLIGGSIGFDDGVSGYVYHGRLHIFDMPPNDMADMTQYLLVIGNWEKISPDLCELEGDLYQFGLSEGIFELPGTDALASALADRFADILKEWLSADQFAEIKRRNETDPAYAGTCCASHDFCDANMVMDAAFRDVLGRGPIFGEEGKEAEENADIALWNAAWELARQRHIGHQK